MNSGEILDFNRRHLYHPYDSTIEPGFCFLAESASGTKIRTAGGIDLIDGVSSWWCMCHGHNQVKIMEAIRRQSEKMAQVMFAGFTHEPAVKLAEALLKKAPKNLDKVFFADSGSVSVECAAKMALQYQLAKGRISRSKLAAVKGGYHGDTANAMALSDPSGMHKMFQGILPRHFFAPEIQSHFDGEWRQSDADNLAELFELHQQEIAAVIIEPVFQGANAMKFYHPEYLRCLKNLCLKYDILLILDEVATGFGRLGKFFALEFAGIEPDIMCVGKGITGGAITLAAVLVSGEVATVISSGNPGKFLHGPTFMANPLACAAGCASLELFEEYDYRKNVKAIEVQLKKELEICRMLPNVADVRVLGAVGVVELKQLPGADVIKKIILENRVWLRPFDKYLYTMPPFITPEDEIKKITDTMGEIAKIKLQ